jgi:hypothetical protein
MEPSGSAHDNLLMQHPSRFLLGSLYAQPRDQEMQTHETQTDANSSAAKFRLVAGAMMVGAILFGVLELFNVIHI